MYRLYNSVKTVKETICIRNGILLRQQVLFAQCQRFTFSKRIDFVK